MKNYTFLTRREYFKTLTEAALKAKRGERVMAAAMSFDGLDPAIIDLVRAFQEAARNGANVRLIIDAHNFLEADNLMPGPLFYRQSLEKLRGKFHATLQLLRDLEAAGGAFSITNIPKRRFNPAPIGRSHIKGAIAGDRVFIGGCNLERPGQIDLMVTWEDETAANTLNAWMQRMVEGRRVRDGFGDVDVEAQLDDTTRLILDAGVPRQSLIYEEALRLIDDAREWVYMTCQFFPGGPTAAHLAAAQARGVRVHIDYSNPRSHGPAAALHRLHQLQQRTRRLPRDLFAGMLDSHMPKLHAKVLASEHEALVGSHNYVIQGVQFGTAEIALHSTDPAFIRDLCAFMQGQLASAQATHSSLSATKADLEV